MKNNLWWAYHTFLKNRLDFKGLKTQNYYVMQGLCFISVVVGQVHAAYKKKASFRLPMYAIFRLKRA